VVEFPLSELALFRAQRLEAEARTVKQGGQANWNVGQSKGCFRGGQAKACNLRELARRLRRMWLQSSVTREQLEQARVER
jgi:hypothetical protein